jgi:hypothetical protein
MPTIKVVVRKCANYNNYEVAYEEETEHIAGSEAFARRSEEIRLALRDEVNDEISKNSPTP